MKLKELLKYADYEIEGIEFYNEYGQLEYCVNLWECELDDIDVVYGGWFEPYGIIKIKRYEKTQSNGKSIQPPESKL